MHAALQTHRAHDAVLAHIIPIIKASCTIVTKDGLDTCVQIKRGDAFVVIALKSAGEVPVPALLIDHGRDQTTDGLGEGQSLESGS